MVHYHIDSNGFADKMNFYYIKYVLEYIFDITFKSSGRGGGGIFMAFSIYDIFLCLVEFPY